MLTTLINVYTLMEVGRPFLPQHLRKEKMLPVRFSASELKELKQRSKRFGVPLAEMVREGIKLYLLRLEQQGESKTKGGQHEDSL